MDDEPHPICSLARVVERCFDFVLNPGGFPLRAPRGRCSSDHFRQILGDVIEIRDHHRQRVVYLVRDACRQSPHRGHSVADHQLRLQLFTFGDVANYRQIADVIARSVDEGSARDVDRDVGSVSVTKSGVADVRFSPPSSRERLLRPHLRRVTHERHGAHSDELSRFVAEHLGEPPVCKDDLSVVVDFQDAIGRGLDDLAVLFFAGAQRVFGPLPIRDVLDDDQ